MKDNQEALSFEPPALLIERFCQEHEVKQADAKERFEETKKFLFLCAINKDRKYSPSQEVDLMWHHFMLHSRTYFDFCASLGVLFLHHEPSDKPEREAYQQTLKDMRDLYGRLNITYWADDGASAGHCGSHCSSCGN